MRTLEEQEKLDAEFEQMKLELERLAAAVAEAPPGIMGEPVMGAQGIQEWVPGGGGGKGLDGFQIYRRDGSSFFVSMAQALTGYDPAVDNDWSLEFGVTAGALDAYAEAGAPPVMSNPVGVSDTPLYDGDAFADPAVEQSFYRVPLMRDGGWVCRGGAFRENRFCTPDGLITELVRIG